MSGSKYSPETTQMIKSEYAKEGASYQKLSDRFNIPIHSIRSMLKGQVSLKTKDFKLDEVDFLNRVIWTNMRTGLSIKQHIDFIHKYFNKIT